MNNLVNSLIDVFNGWNKEVVVFIVSLLPILELRGGLLASTLLKVKFSRAFFICILGNILPIPLVLLFLDYIFTLLKKWNVTKKIVDWFEKKFYLKESKLTNMVTLDLCCLLVFHYQVLVLGLVLL